MLFKKQDGGRAMGSRVNEDEKERS